MDTTRVAELATPLAEAAGLEVYDVEQHGNVLRVSLSPSGGDVDVDALESVSRSLSIALDEEDSGGGAYLLEVSSPGVERALKSVRHFATAVGEIVTVTTVPGPDGRRRLRGELTAVDADTESVTVADAESGATDLRLVDIEKARTIFEWGPAPKPGKGPNPARSKAAAAKNSSTKNQPSTDSEASS